MALNKAGSKNERNVLVVVAIEIGTTNSGYAYSFEHDYQRDPTEVTFHKWFSDSLSYVSFKAPTAVLFNKRKEFESFGYEAETMNSEYALDGEDRNHFFFNRFLIELSLNKINNEFELSDTHGRRMPAIRVFGEVIKYFTGVFLETQRRRGITLRNADIHWVLTVPAVCGNFAKQIMRESACLANIDGSHLSIVPEPVAALLYCQLITTNKIHVFEGAKFTVGNPCSKYMVIDLGGDIANFTVHERQSDSGLKEVYEASDVSCGGGMVESEFEHLLINIFKIRAFNKVCDKHSEDHLDLLREVGIKMRKITPKSEGKITIRVPFNLAKVYKTFTRDTVRNAIENSPYKGKITWLSDKIRIDAEILKGLFKPCIDNLVKHIKDILKYKELKGTNTFLMIGEFSESEMVQEAVMKALPCMHVIVPDEAGLSVLKGAVIFGHRPVTVVSRVSKYTYDDYSDDDEGENNPMYKHLEMPAKNSLERTIAPPQGTPDWFRHHYKTNPRSPTYWTVYTDNKTLKDWRLDSDDPRPKRIPVDRQTFDAVKRVALATWQYWHVGHGRDAKGLDNLNYSTIQIQKVERIENCELFEKYATKRQEMFHQASKYGAFQDLENVKGSSGQILTTHKIPKDSVLSRDIHHEINEHYMFHGTQESVADAIIKQGLDCRLGGTKAMFGQGVYAAESSTKSDQYTDPKFYRSSNEKKMFLIRMCLGKIYVENTPKPFARAPCMMCYKDKCSCKDNCFFDSVVGDGHWNFREFVVYDRTQVYPEYLITYVRV